LTTWLEFANEPNGGRADIEGEGGNEEYEYEYESESE
jgi:hypothetical protein